MQVIVTHGTKYSTLYFTSKQNSKNISAYNVKSGLIGIFRNEQALGEKQTLPIVKKEDNEGPTLEIALDKLKTLKKAHLEMGKAMLLADGGKIFPFDLFATGVFSRSIKLIDGFITLIPDNFICAAPIVRMQIDNFLRTSAVLRVDMNAHEFAIKVLNGTKIKDMQDKETRKKLTDRTLVEIFSNQYPGLSEIYHKGSSYIHFSNTHIFHSVSASDAADGATIEGHITEAEPYVTEKLRTEAAITMANATKILLDQLDNWTFTKNNAELVDRLRKEGYDAVILTDADKKTSPPQT